MQDWMIEEIAQRVAENVADFAQYEDFRAAHPTTLDQARSELSRVDEWELSRSAVEGVDVPKSNIRGLPASGLLTTTREYRVSPTPEEDEQIARRVVEIIESGTVLG